MSNKIALTAVDVLRYVEYALTHSNRDGALSLIQEFLEQFDKDEAMRVEEQADDNKTAEE